MPLPPSLKRFKYLSKKLTTETQLASSSNSSDDSVADVTSELQCYLTEVKNMGSTQSIDGPLNFWLDRVSTYPKLSLLATDLVSAPASQAYVERLFSLCGQLTAGKRNRTSVTLALRVFLKLNGALLDSIVSVSPSETESTTH